MTRDFGAEVLLAASVADPSRSETVARFLDREAEIETSFGGNFVDSIGGLSGGSKDGRRSDWFFYVNGYWSPVGAAESRVRPGDRIWWDYRDWEAAYRVPAVVGSWPQPFASGLEGKRFPTSVDCTADPVVCDEVATRLEEVGAELIESAGDPIDGGSDRGAAAEDNAGASSDEQLRVIVGPWEALRSDPAAELVAAGPGSSGVYGEFERVGQAWELVGLDPRGDERARFGAGAGLVAAVRVGDRQPTWLITGTDDAGVEAAVELLAVDALRDRYAVVVAGAGATDPGDGIAAEGRAGPGDAIALPILEPQADG